MSGAIVYDDKPEVVIDDTQESKASEPVLESPCGQAIAATKVVPEEQAKSVS